MKHLVKPLSASVAAVVLAAASFAPVANAEVSASAGVANLYLWRGVDLGDGSPAVFGDLKYSVGGAYVGIWGTSGDSGLGQEYDLFAGYGGEIGPLSYDISIWNYNYPDAGLRGMPGKRDDTFGELTEIVLTLGVGPVTFQYYDNIAGNTGYNYYTLSGAFGPFTAKVGYHDPDAKDSAMTHVDLTYAYNERLSFTLSKVVDDESEGHAPIFDDNGDVVGIEQLGYDDDLNFVVTYTLPIDL